MNRSPSDSRKGDNWFLLIGFCMWKGPITSALTATFLLLPFIAYGASPAPSPSDQTDQSIELSLKDILNIKVTTASKTEEKLSEAPGVISVVTRDEMERFGARNLKDVLMRMPSFALSAIYMTDRSSVAIRGDQLSPAANHILLLINGRPVREAMEGGIKSEMYESFPVASIDRIEVIRGPGSVLYGSNAFSGVINVITKKATENKAEVSLDGGVPGEGKVAGNVAYQLGNFGLGDLGLVLGGQYKKAENWDVRFQAGDTVFRDFSIPDNGYGTFAELNWGNLTYMTSYDYWRNFFAMQKYIPSILPYVPPSIVGKHAYSNVAWDKWFNDLGYKQKISDIWEMTFNATYTQSWLVVDSFPGPRRNSYDLTGEWTNFFRPKEELNIILGFLGNRAAGKEWGLTTSEPEKDSSQNSFSGYIQADYRLISEIKIIAGVQGNKPEGFDLDLNPRLGLIWSPGKIVNVKALYSTAFRAPTIQERYNTALTLKGTPTLKPEKIETVDLGVNIQTDKIMIGINNYYSTISNSIYQKQHTPPPSVYANSAIPTTIIGMEVEGKYFITKELMLTGSGLYQQNTTGDSAGNMMPVPEALAKGGVSYAARGFAASVFNIYEGRLDDRYDAAYNKTCKAFDLLNANVKYDIGRIIELPVSKITLTVDAYNLLNREIWLPATGQSTHFTLPEIQGRSLYFGITVGL
jgi:outer membrane receptor for ferrienterochelin and colicins